jgi:hypothetical protein
MLNYRWQATMESSGAPAFSPRISFILPTGNASRGFGNGGPGWQVNLPLSKQYGDAYVHWNGGFTHIPSAEADGVEHHLFTPHVALSGIWRLRPMLNLMLESVVQWEDGIDDLNGGQTVVTLSPGFRTGWNAGDAQTIVGVAAPVAFSGGTSDVGVFGYFSYELPFRRQP